MSDTNSHKKIFLFFRPIVQLVERAAHDGFVVGSNPAGPIITISNIVLRWTLIQKIIKMLN